MGVFNSVLKAWKTFYITGINIRRFLMKIYLYINKIFDYINSKSPVLIFTPWVEFVGNCAEEIYFALLKARREGKKALFLYPGNLLPVKKFRFIISNYELFNIESDYTITGNSNWCYLLKLFITLFYNPLRFYYCLRKVLLIRILGLEKFREQPDTGENMLNHYWYRIPSIGRSILYKPADVDYFSWDIVKELKWKEQFLDPLPVRLNKNKKTSAEKMRIKMGIPADRWFVCLHVRESSFYNDNHRPWRNSSVFNYIKGIKAIVERGGYVVRMGDKNMTPLPKLKNVIDYPHTEFKSELMDIYLLSECKFFIGTNSGLNTMAQLFQKRMILINLSDWVLFSLNKNSLAIIKHIYSHYRNRFLSIKEILGEPFECIGNMRLGKDYIMFENTPDEIKDVIIEFLNNAENPDYSELQKECMQKKKHQVAGWLEKGILFDNAPIDLIQTYRHACFIECEKGALGHKYLKENWLEDSMNHYYNLK